MSLIECCVCLDDAEHYTNNTLVSKCKHPICKNCYTDMINKVCIEDGSNMKCPLCRTPIKDDYTDINMAIDRVKTTFYECILDTKCLYKNEIVYIDDDDIWIIMLDEITKTKRPDIKKRYKYFHKHTNKYKKIKKIYRKM